MTPGFWRDLTAWLSAQKSGWAYPGAN